MWTGLTDLQTHGLIPEMRTALILADMERTVNIKWASHAAVCSWESMNCWKTFCQTSIGALKKSHCCHKCCECTECTSRGSVLQSRYMHTAPCRITALLASSMEVYGNRWGISQLRLPVFVAHLKSPTVSWPRSQVFPTSSLSVYTHGTFESNSAFLGNLSMSGKYFLEFIDSQLQIAVRLCSSWGINCMFHVS